MDVELQGLSKSCCIQTIVYHAYGIDGLGIIDEHNVCIAGKVSREDFFRKTNLEELWGHLVCSGCRISNISTYID